MKSKWLSRAALAAALLCALPGRAQDAGTLGKLRLFVDVLVHEIDPEPNPDSAATPVNPT